MNLQPYERQALENELADLKGTAGLARDAAIASYVAFVGAISDLRRTALRGAEIRSVLAFGEPGPTLEGLTDPLGLVVPGDEWAGLLKDAAALAAGAFPRRIEEAAVSVTFALFGKNRSKAADAAQEIR